MIYSRLHSLELIKEYLEPRFSSFKAKYLLLDRITPINTNHSSIR